MRRPALALMMLAACAHVPAAVPPRERTVVVISVDGLPGYTFDEPRAATPTLRRLIAEGAHARGGVQIINPAITWPNHTTLATGVRASSHGVVYNGRLLRPGPRQPPRVEQRDRADLVRAPTLYDLAAAAGLSTAQVDWVPTQVGGTITWAFPERPSAEGPLEREMVAGGLLTAADLAEWRQSTITWKDEIWTRAASYLIRQHRPNLLYLHLLNLDATHHRYAPRTVAGASSVALADARIREVLDALGDAGLKDRATVFVVSDHGFREVHHHVRANAALRAAGLIQSEGNRVTSCDAWVVAEGGTGMVYVTDPARRDEILARVKETLGHLEGVVRVIDPVDYAALGYPNPADNDQMADLVVAARPGYAFDAAIEGEPVVALPPGLVVGAHGYLADDREMNATFIAWGHGIRRGARVERMRNVDVAPTVAAALGIEMKAVAGRVVREIFAP